MSETKKCKECNVEKDISEYYLVGAERRVRSKKCKKCYNANRNKYYNPRPRANKVTGFLKQPEDKQYMIIRDLHTMSKVRPVAIKHGIEYCTLRSWIRKGQIPAYKPDVN
jgi:hypothetical protein